MSLSRVLLVRIFHSHLSGKCEVWVGDPILRSAARGIVETNAENRSTIVDERLLYDPVVASRAMYKHNVLGSKVWLICFLGSLFVSLAAGQWIFAFSVSPCQPHGSTYCLSKGFQLAVHLKAATHTDANDLKEFLDSESKEQEQDGVDPPGKSYVLHSNACCLLKVTDRHFVFPRLDSQHHPLRC